MDPPPAAVWSCRRRSASIPPGWSRSHRSTQPAADRLIRAASILAEPKRLGGWMVVAGDGGNCAQGRMTTYKRSTCERRDLPHLHTPQLCMCASQRLVPPPLFSCASGLIVVVIYATGRWVFRLLPWDDVGRFWVESVLHLHPRCAVELLRWLLSSSPLESLAGQPGSSRSRS